MNALKQVIKAILPHGLVELRRKYVLSRPPPDDNRVRDEFHKTRQKRIAAAESAGLGARPFVDGENRAAVVDFLTSRGIPLQQVLEGSVPEASLRFLRERLLDLPAPSEPVIALHIGNFVGVSLAFLASVLNRRHPESLVIAVDPNLPHRGVFNPQEHVSALLCACGLQNNTMLIAGYSGFKSVSNDGVAFFGYDPAKRFQREAACEHTLRNLRKIFAGRCDLAIMDGNHEARYLVTEIGDILPLMRRNGLLVFDDVDSGWAEIRALFEQAREHGLDPVATDGRIGLARIL